MALHCHNTPGLPGETLYEIWDMLTLALDASERPADEHLWAEPSTRSSPVVGGKCMTQLAKNPHSASQKSAPDPFRQTRDCDIVGGGAARFGRRTARIRTGRRAAEPCGLAQRRRLIIMAPLPEVAPDSLEVLEEIESLFQYTMERAKRPPLRALSALLHAPRDLDSLVGREHSDLFEIDQLRKKINPVLDFQDTACWFDSRRIGLQNFRNVWLGIELGGKSGFSILKELQETSSVYRNTILNKKHYSFKRAHFSDPDWPFFSKCVSEIDSHIQKLWEDVCVTGRALVWREVGTGIFTLLTPSNWATDKGAGFGTEGMRERVLFTRGLPADVNTTSAGGPRPQEVRSAETAALSEFSSRIRAAGGSNPFHLKSRALKWLIEDFKLSRKGALRVWVDASREFSHISNPGRRPDEPPISN